MRLIVNSFVAEEVQAHHNFLPENQRFLHNCKISHFLAPAQLSSPNFKSPL